jgi:hypothetical protein
MKGMRLYQKLLIMFLSFVRLCVVPCLPAGRFVILCPPAPNGTFGRVVQLVILTTKVHKGLLKGSQRTFDTAPLFWGYKK